MRMRMKQVEEAPGQVALLSGHGRRGGQSVLSPAPGAPLSHRTQAGQVAAPSQACGTRWAWPHCAVSEAPCAPAPRKRPYPAVAVPPGVAVGQILPVIHQLDRGRMGVQAR